MAHESGSGELSSRFNFVVVLASAVLNGVALLVGRGSFEHWFAVTVMAISVGGPAVVLAVSAHVLRNRFRFARRLARVATLVPVVSASTVISLLPGRELAKHDIAAAKAYCDSIISQLERVKRASGAYPSDLSRCGGTATDRSSSGDRCDTGRTASSTS